MSLPTNSFSHAPQPTTFPLQQDCSTWTNGQMRAVPCQWTCCPLTLKLCPSLSHKIVFCDYDTRQHTSFTGRGQQESSLLRSLAWESKPLSGQAPKLAKPSSAPLQPPLLTSSQTNLFWGRSFQLFNRTPLVNYFV